MKATTLKTAAILAGSLSFLAGSAFSQSAVSDPGGYRTQKIGDGFNLVGVNLHNPVIISGSIDTETGADVGDSAVDYTAILNDPAATYIFEVLDGDQIGAIAEITAVANGSVTVDGAGIGAGIGAAYSIRQAPTLIDTFGDLNPGFSATTADVVYIPTGIGGQYDQFFQHTTGVFRAQGSISNPPKPVSFLYSDGLLIERKDGPLDLIITGMVKKVGTIVNIPNGFGAVAVSAPVGSTLQDCGIAASLKTGFSATTADVVYVPTLTAGGDANPGVYDQYFVHTTGNFRAQGAIADADPVPIDNGLLIERKDPDTAGLIDVPAFFANL
jgi:hypothetical protein